MPAPQDATAPENGLSTPPPGTRRRRSALGRSGTLGALLLALIALPCILGLPWAFGPGPGASPRYRDENLAASRLPPAWAAHDERETQRREAASGARAAPVRFLLGSDALGRDLLSRCIAGGAISLGVGAAAAIISLVVGTLYGMVSGFAGGRTDAVMMRIVDVLYGLPYILLVVLLSVAASALADQRDARALRRVHEQRAAFVERALASAQPESSPSASPVVPGAESPPDARARAEAAAAAAHPTPPEARGRWTRVLTLVGAIGAVSWLTMARVVRGQTLSLRARPFVESARAIGASPARILRVHILPNLAAPIVVYATLTVPQAILQESFLSFLGVGVPAPLPSWGNLVADGLGELNTVKSRWWLLLFPCLLLTLSLLSMNLLGEALRERLNPRARRA